MITTSVPSTSPRSLLARLLRPKIIAIFSFRYDAHLVPDLIENITPLCDGWVSWDDRKTAAVFTGDSLRRQALYGAAYAAGAQWLLCVDPDERFEIGTASRIRSMALYPGHTSWTFNLREMYTPTAWRSDGIWGGKRQRRFFRIFENQFPIAERGTFAAKPLHDQWVPPGYRTLHSGLNLYHLKMIDPKRRTARRDLYNVLDPERRYQKIGYDYLADDSGIELIEIHPRRRYLPAHNEDHGLWMADAAQVAAERD
jgi:hypothetical protein